MSNIENQDFEREVQKMIELGYLQELQQRLAKQGTKSVLKDKTFLTISLREANVCIYCNPPLTQRYAVLVKYKAVKREFACYGMPWQDVLALIADVKCHFLSGRDWRKYNG